MNLYQNEWITDSLQQNNLNATITHLSNKSIAQHRRACEERLNDVKGTCRGRKWWSSSCRPRMSPAEPAAVRPVPTCAEVRALSPFTQWGATPQGPRNRTLNPGPLSELRVTSGKPEKYVSQKQQQPRQPNPVPGDAKGAPGGVNKKMWEQGILGGWSSVSAIDAGLTERETEAGRGGMHRVHSPVDSGPQSSSLCSGKVAASQPPSEGSPLASHRHWEPFMLNKVQTFKLWLQLRL